MSNYAKIKKFDIANGKGIRTSIFFSGCTLKCKGCFNSELWDFNVGQPFNKEVYETKIKSTMNEHIAGLSILGGDPLHPKNQRATYDLCRWFKEDFPDKNIWLWTGYDIQFDTLFKALNHNFMLGLVGKIVMLCDIIVDQPFIEEQKDLTLPWCGSRNQRVIDIQKTIAAGEVVLYE